MSAYDSDIVDSVCFGNVYSTKNFPQEFGNDSTELGDSGFKSVDYNNDEQKEKNRHVLEKKRLIEAQDHLRRAHSP